MLCQMCQQTRESKRWSNQAYSSRRGHRHRRGGVVQDGVAAIQDRLEREWSRVEVELEEIHPDQTKSGETSAILNVYTPQRLGGDQWQLILYHIEDDIWDGDLSRSEGHQGRRFEHVVSFHRSTPDAIAEDIITEIQLHAQTHVAARRMSARRRCYRGTPSHPRQPRAFPRLRQRQGRLAPQESPRSTLESIYKGIQDLLHDVSSEQVYDTLSGAADRIDQARWSYPADGAYRTLQRAAEMLWDLDWIQHSDQIRKWVRALQKITG